MSSPNSRNPFLAVPPTSSLPIPHNSNANSNNSNTLPQNEAAQLNPHNPFRSPSPFPMATSTSPFNPFVQSSSSSPSNPFLAPSPSLKPSAALLTEFDPFKSSNTLRSQDAFTSINSSLSAALPPPYASVINPSSNAITTQVNNLEEDERLALQIALGQEPTSQGNISQIESDEILAKRLAEEERRGSISNSSNNPGRNTGGMVASSVLAVSNDDQDDDATLARILQEVQ
ncbi:hypothetical protein BCR33DRAFT_714483 [Rhizoclosmatium globosum]|uniref:Uncharacterized protein n=1 Tax=Rhizoclosmatium globosum TaxID=329046 RepID=A0A1Y2CM83_9FUNG|nr:hypothetical protein BCR33DRAFT_714483 [Rhizoclosmatium globosum]|eukprot:ORY48036.1 hypothetical protein BCR33DRAFT_714483 [Rhizoclosmatium globosum]